MKARLLTLSSAAVLAVYTAGYARTRSAAEMLEAEDRRPPMPRPDSVDRTPIPPAPSAAPAVEDVGLREAEKDAPVHPVADPSVAATSRTAEAPRGERPEKPVASAALTAAQLPQASPAPKLVATPPKTVAEKTADGAMKVADGGPSLASQATAAAIQLPAPAAESGLPPAAAPQAPPAPSAPAAARWKDGRYTGWGTSRHGDIQATVQIEAGRIATASISQCLTRYPCDWIVKLPSQVVQRQSAETDFISGATESTNAFYYAILEALGKAAK